MRLPCHDDDDPHSIYIDEVQQGKILTDIK